MPLVVEEWEDYPGEYGAESRCDHASDEVDDHHEERPLEVPSEERHKEAKHECRPTPADVGYLKEPRILVLQNN